MLRPGQSRPRHPGRSCLRRRRSTPGSWRSNVKDGSVAWEQTLDDWQKAYSSTGAPLVVGDMVIAGVGGAEYRRARLRPGAQCRETGEPLWTTNMIPGPGEPGNETWPGDTWKTGGG